MSDIVDRLFDATDKDAVSDAMEEINNLRSEVERCKGLHSKAMDGWQKTLEFNNQLVTANTTLRAEVDALANDRDGYVQLLTNENNTLRAENERLRAALEDVLSYVPHGDMPVTIYDTARAALGENT